MLEISKLVQPNFEGYDPNKEPRPKPKKKRKKAKKVKATRNYEVCCTSKCACAMLLSAALACLWHNTDKISDC